MKRTLYEVSDGLCEEAVYMWEKEGFLLTTAFAMGHSRALFAQPRLEDVPDIDIDTRIRIQALLGASTGAVFIGRIDQSYLKYQEPDAPRPNADDLYLMSLNDPSVRRAIAVHGTDVASGHSYVSMAVLGVDDDGEPEWEYESYDNPEGDYVIQASKTLLAMEMMTTPMTDAQLREELKSIGWLLADSDEIPSNYGEEQ